MATSGWGALLSFGLGWSADESGHFAADDSLRQRLASIPVPPGVSYTFPQILPQRLDELLSSVPRP